MRRWAESSPSSPGLTTTASFNSLAPLVSIITPSFNQARYLDAAVQSVLSQDYASIEHILVDGGSTDGSLDIIRTYEDRLAYWVSEKDAGQADAINKGLARANGEIIAWLNSDDYYLPGAISDAVRVLSDQPDALMVYGNLLAVDERDRRINVLKYRQLTLEDLLRFQIIGQPGVVFRRAALEQAGPLDTSFQFLLDHHLWIRIARRGPILHVPRTWAAARYHPEAKNRARAVEFGREAFRILEWARSDPSLKDVMRRVERPARAAAHRVDARYRLDGGEPWSALKAWTRALLTHPPTALARLNLLVSALLNLIGLGRVRDMFLTRRQRAMREDG